MPRAKTCADALAFCMERAAQSLCSATALNA
jgi:hypothetical protein